MGFGKVNALQYGPAPGVIGDRQVAQVPATKAASPPIQIDRHFRNNKHPDPGVFSAMNEGVNQSMLYRTKEAFAVTGLLGTGAGLGVSSFGVGDRARWRGAFHTSPYTHALLCSAVMYPQNNGYQYDSYARLDIYSDATETTLVASTEFHYGPSPTGSASASGWQYLKVVDKWIDGLAADTDYYCKVTDVDYGLIQSICIADMQSMSANYAGYLPQNFTDESQLLDEYRENLAAPLPLMWKRGGAKVLNWTRDSQSSPRTISVNVATNLIDGTSTTYGDDIPGYTLDMTGKARLSQSTGVPFVVQVYMSCTAAVNGVVNVRDSTGTIVATVGNSHGAGVGGWNSATGLLPASRGKYYLTYRTALGTLSVHAASIYEYEA